MIFQLIKKANAFLLSYLLVSTSNQAHKGKPSGNLDRVAQGTRQINPYNKNKKKRTKPVEISSLIDYVCNK